MDIRAHIRGVMIHLGHENKKRRDRIFDAEIYVKKFQKNSYFKILKMTPMDYTEALGFYSVTQLKVTYL